MLEWLVENWDTLKAYAPLAGAFASGVAAMGTWLGLRRRVGRWLADRRGRRLERRHAAERERRLQMIWYAEAFQALVFSGRMSPSVFCELTVPEACAAMGQQMKQSCPTPLPAWATGLWLRRRLKWFN